MALEIPKYPHFMSHIKGIMGRQVGHHGGAPPLAGHPCGAPPKGVPSPQAFSKIFWTKSTKGGFPKNIPKSTFTIHEDIFQRPLIPKIFLWARTILAPTKIILNGFRNNFGTMFFFSEKLPQRFRLLRNISGFHPGKFPEVTRTILALSKNFQTCAETNLT